MNKIRRIGSVNALYLLILVSVGGCERPSSESLPTGTAVTPPPAANGPYQATGMKIGEVTATEAIIWTRLTREPARIGSEAPLPEFRYRAPGSDELREAPPGRFHPHDWTPVVIYPEGSSLDTIEGAVRGAPGESRVLYRPTGGVEWRSTAWTAVDPERDFTRQFTLTGLGPATEYVLRG